MSLSIHVPKMTRDEDPIDPAEVAALRDWLPKLGPTALTVMQTGVLMAGDEGLYPKGGQFALTYEVWARMLGISGCKLRAVFARLAKYAPLSFQWYPEHHTIMSDFHLRGTPR